jgi:hypothetical protein
LIESGSTASNRQAPFTLQALRLRNSLHISWMAAAMRERGGPTAMNRMNWHAVAHGAVAALATLLMALTASVAAVSEELKPPAPGTPAQESAKSSPPDTNRYIRPAIPEDRMNTPLPPPRSGNPRPPVPDDSSSAQPRPR